MKPRELASGVWQIPAIDWDGRLFDSLIPLPDGTSYNAYLVQGSEKTALLDTADPGMTHVLLAELKNVDKVDLVVSHHAEQDHSGTIPQVLDRYPHARLLCTPQAQEMLQDLLHIDPARFQTVADGERISLGGKTLRFLHMPWVHWPETMVTYLEEDRILFTCDFFGSHLATSELYADWSVVRDAAKRYYAEIMMPFAKTIAGHLRRVRELDVGIIAPSHGPVYRDPQTIIGAWESWVSGPPKNLAVIAWVTMHGSTRRMVDRLSDALVDHGVSVQRFELVSTDIGKLAMALVDAATIIIATPTVIAHPHPHALFAAYLTKLIRPKAKFATVIGSYGWGGKAVETLADILSGSHLELIEPVLCKGAPRAENLQALDELAATIARKHHEAGIVG